MSAQRPLVAVLLGTDHHRFDRLVAWTGDLASGGGIDWFVQHGATPMPARQPWLSGLPMLASKDLEDLLRRADAVVTHGGPGLIMEARTHGHLPVVVARDPGLGEHVDDHQQRFVRRIAGTGSVLAADSPLELADAVRTAMELRLREVDDPATRPLRVAAAGGPDQGPPEVTPAERFGRLVDLLVERSRAARR
jgi:UDP-N-acetylglucosamine transferase subunit ALG13